MTNMFWIEVLYNDEFKFDWRNKYEDNKIGN